MNKFIIEYKNTKHRFCLMNIDDASFNSGEKLEIIKKHRNYQCHINDNTKENLDTLIVASSELEPLVFYRQDDYLKCSKTNYYVCCLHSKYECCGGSILFLSENIKYAINFGKDNIDNINTNNHLFFIKSKIYPGWGHPAGLICPRGGGCCKHKGSVEKGPIIAYHIEPLSKKWEIEAIPVIEPPKNTIKSPKHHNAKTKGSIPMMKMTLHEY